jgi:hypothetical protein
LLFEVAMKNPWPIEIDDRNDDLPIKNDDLL